MLDDYYYIAPDSRCIEVKGNGKVVIKTDRETKTETDRQTDRLKDRDRERTYQKAL